MNDRAREAAPAPEVVAALRAWGQAPTLDAAHKSLRQASRRLAGTQKTELVRWTARLSIESLVEVMASMEGIDAADAVEWEGMAFHPRQLERLAAWAKDQAATAEALGVERSAWADSITAAIPWLQAQAKNLRAGPEADAIKAARKFLGG